MIENMMREHLKEFTNYIVPDNDYKYVLNANESPFSLFDIPVLKDILLEKIKNYNSNLYPEGTSRVLRNSISNYTGVPADSIICGNGSDELIPMIFNCFLNPGEAVVSHYPSFDMYKVGTQIARGRFFPINDLADHSIDVDSMIKTANEQSAKIIFVCVPNNPTGYFLEKSQVERIINETNSIVVLDEAYVDFSKYNCLDLIEKHERLIILRTLSKALGMAGLRVGYALGQQKMIDILNKVKQPYNLNSLSQLIASTALDNFDLLKDNISLIASERDYMMSELKKIPNIQVFDSQANFILIRVPDGEKTNKALLEESIFLKYYGQKPSLENCFRITVSTRKINDLVLSTLKAIW
ncbi:histidinol-phosphate transaminase [Alkalibacter mobilis]|uniref:histidinol-phosphate transaminase n=1 Tax=Alkalibacter mobilis TaxID=2787712 RepID=UPI00189FF002|nr:histidinol-phosphate transaminase [Alkalibacter mobilis]MBF7097817.1 histidinol-phosphate transaminase [Alkalibacter mobilis]